MSGPTVYHSLLDDTTNTSSRDATTILKQKHYMPAATVCTNRHNSICHRDICTVRWYAFTGTMCMAVPSKWQFETSKSDLYGVFPTIYAHVYHSFLQSPLAQLNSTPLASTATIPVQVPCLRLVSKCIPPPCSTIRQRLYARNEENL